MCRVVWSICALCVALAAIADPSAFLFRIRPSTHLPRRAWETPRGVHVARRSRATHNSYLGELFDRQAKEIDQLDDKTIVSNLQRVAQVCQLGTHTSVLDVGTGHGFMLPFFAECGVKLSSVTGVDLSAGMLTHARERYPSATFIHDDILRFEDQNCQLYDRVVFNSCFGHIYDQKSALRHVTEELIAGGGLVIISEPRGKTWLDESRKSYPKEILHEMPSKRDLERLISSVGSSKSSGVDSYQSALLSLESMVDEDDFYCAVLRRSCADF